MAIDIAAQIKAVLGIETDESGLTDEERSDWDTRVLEYTSWWEQYSGESISATDERNVGRDGKRQKRWPLQINMEGISCRLHQQALMGEVKDPARSSATIRQQPIRGSNPDPFGGPSGPGMPNSGPQ